MNDSADIPVLRAGDRWSAAGLPGPRSPSLRVFGAVLAAGFCLLGALLIRGATPATDPWRAAAAAGSFVAALGAGAVAFVAPARLRPLYSSWMRFGRALGDLVGRVLLTIVFFAVVTPTGWLMRLTGTDPLDRARGGQPRSRWRPRPGAREPEHFRHLS